MKQILQDIRSGTLSVADVPAPVARPGEVVIANEASVISAGTEKMATQLAKKSLLGKARERPDHVRRVLEKVRSEGLVSTIQQVQTKLDEPTSMGYSSAGIVLACGEGVQEYKPGDRVASNGCHAEIVGVPKNLCARVPDNLPMDQAALAVIGSIALQGTRLTETQLGETVLVIGLGLVGQMAVALLSAAGCRVIGTDLDADKCELALKMGAEVAQCGLKAGQVEQMTGGLGADAVLIAASTKSKGPMDLAAAAIRQKGRVVLVGVVGLELDRRPFYFKEAEFVVSCSYGPGRYDSDYEERGFDYPAAHVRWTEQRNIQAVLEMMARGRLDVSPLISHRIPIEKAEQAYRIIDEGSEPYLGIVLTYANSGEDQPTRRVELRSVSPQNGKIGAGVLGAGNFARMVLLPGMNKTQQFHHRVICSPGGLSAAHTGDRMGFEIATSDEDEVFGDERVDAVFSITRHDQHAGHVLKAIKAGKHVFVEKPLCLTLEELAEIEQAVADRDEAAARLIMVGFNRRFSPAAVQLKQFFQSVQAPLAVSIRFNAGEIPAEHWTQNGAEGGGRIIGEACHAIDLATFLTGSVPARVYAESVGGPTTPKVTDDQCFITIRHANGSISNVAYLAGGDKAFPKERVEVIGGGRVGVIDDFKMLTTCSGGKTKKTKLPFDKGHQAEIEAFARAIREGGEPLISWSEIRAVTAASILAVRSLREGVPKLVVSC